MKLIQKVENRLAAIRFKKSLTRISKYKEIDGWLSEKEAVGLFDIAAKLPADGTIVEIGSWKGKSTYCMAMGLRSGKVFAVDPFNAEGEPGSKEIYEQKKGTIPLFEQFQNTFKENGLSDKVEPLMGYSDKFVDKFTGIDFLFIDGDHSIKGCDFDYVSYAPKIKIGGYLGFHDFDPNRDELGPTWVIKNKVLNNPEYKFYGVYDSLWVAIKVK